MSTWCRPAAASGVPVVLLQRDVMCATGSAVGGRGPGVRTRLSFTEIGRLVVEHAALSTRPAR